METVKESKDMVFLRPLAEKWLAIKKVDAQAMLDYLLTCPYEKVHAFIPVLLALQEIEVAPPLIVRTVEAGDGDVEKQLKVLANGR